MDVDLVLEWMVTFFIGFCGELRGFAALLLLMTFVSWLFFTFVDELRGRLFDTKNSLVIFELLLAKALEIAMVSDFRDAFAVINLAASLMLELINGILFGLKFID